MKKTRKREEMNTSQLLDHLEAELSKIKHDTGIFKLNDIVCEARRDLEALRRIHARETLHGANAKILEVGIGHTGLSVNVRSVHDVIQLEHALEGIGRF